MAKDLVSLAKAEGAGSDVGRLVIAGDGTMLGTVSDVLGDRELGEVRFLAIALDASVARRPGGKQVFVPVTAVRTDAVTGRVHLDEVTGEDAVRLPEQPTEGPLPAMQPGAIAGHGHTTMAAASTAAASTTAPPSSSVVEGEGEVRMTLSDEEMRVAKRMVESGEVRVRKHVESEQVREVVTVLREDVDVERRPLPPGAGLEPRVEGDIIYVPIVEEELVVTKRLVAHEELVIRKRQVEHQQVIEETLRHETVEVLGAGDVDRVEHPERVDPV